MPDSYRIGALDPTTVRRIHPAPDRFSETGHAELRRSVDIPHSSGTPISATFRALAH